MKKTSRILAVIIAVITITCLMAIATSAVTYNVAVGGTASLPKGPENDYGPALNDYTLSDPTLAKIVDRDTIQFLKPGTLTVTNHWNLWDGQNPIPRKGTITRTYEIKYPTPIEDTTIKLESGEFCGGRAFPEFSVGANKLYEVTEATFYKEMVDYYVGDTLPHYKAGTVVNYVRVTLKPKVGQSFAFVGHEDGKTYESTVYTVEYEGKKYTPYVKNSYAENELWVYLDVTFSEGAFYTVNVKDLDAPYHNGPLDKEVTVDSALEVVSVKYTMFSKELDAFKKGDNVGITVRLRSKDGKNTFNPEGRAYWKEQGVYSIQTKLISSTEVEYTFTYKVDALPEQYVDFVYIALPAYTVGDKPMNVAFANTKGIVIKEVKWDETFEVFEKDKTYGLNVIINVDDDHFFTDKFIVSIDGKETEFEKKSSGGVKDKFESSAYSIPAKVTPVTVLNVNGNTGTDTNVSDTYIGGTTTPEFNINLKYNENDITAEQGEKVILDFTHDMDLMLCSNIHYQWYKATGNIYGTGEPVEGGDKKQLQAHTYEVGTDYYYCIMTCEFDGSKYTSDHSDSPVVKVTVTESTAKDFFIYPVGKVDVTVTKPTEFSLKVAAEGYGKQDVLYTWFACDKDGNVDFSTDSYNVLSNTDTLTVSGIPLEKANIPHYYKCIGNIYGGESEVIFTVTLIPETIPEEEIPEEKFELVADGEQDVIIYSWEEKVTLKAKVTNTDKYADFQWFTCDKDGNTIGNGIPLSMGDSVTVGPIAQDKMMVPQYYRCTAMVGNTAKSVVFTVLLAPMGVEEEYVFPFTDVSEKSWYYESVLSAHRDGLINGKTETKFMPEDNMTVAEAIKLAVCMNILFNGGDPNTDIKVGTPVWYSTYMDYAVKHGIIEEDLSARANQAISRAEYVTIFCAAIPAKNLAAKNTIPAGSIPDVEEDKSDVGNAIYTFYRAGIIAGVDKAGTFNFYANIKRAEVAAVLARITSPSLRVGAPENLGK